MERIPFFVLTDFHDGEQFLAVAELLHLGFDIVKIDFDK